jgi:CrcB protein
MTWLLVGLGGALGSMARHGLNHLVHQRAIASTFPFGIFLVNVIGSVAIGVVAGLLAPGRLHASYEMRIFLIVGVLGGFTTFSSFSLDTLALMRGGHTLQAAGNVAGQVGLSLLGVWVGFRLGAR